MSSQVQIGERRTTQSCKESACQGETGVVTHQAMEGTVKAMVKAIKAATILERISVAVGLKACSTTSATVAAIQLLNTNKPDGTPSVLHGD